MKMRLTQAIEALRMEPNECLVHKMEGVKIGHTKGRGFWITFEDEYDTFNLPYDGWVLSNEPQNGSMIGQEFM